MIDTTGSIEKMVESRAAQKKHSWLSKIGLRS